MTGGPVTFTLDVEDYTAPGAEPRAVDTTRKILAFLAERGVRGTFFVVGEFAEEQSDLVREIARGGHEIGLHSYRHAPLTETDPDTFRREVGKARASGPPRKRLGPSGSRSSIAATATAR